MKESAYAAVLGWKNALNVDPRVKQQVADDGSRKTDAKAEHQGRDPRAREQKMLAAFDIYINYIKDPKDEELVGMKFLKANIYRRYNHYDEAHPDLPWTSSSTIKPARDRGVLGKSVARYAINSLEERYQGMRRRSVNKLDGDKPSSSRARMT